MAKHFFGDPSKAVTGITPALSRFCSPTDCTVRSEIWKLWSSVSVNLGKKTAASKGIHRPHFSVGHFGPKKVA